jgi:hypothetical protein
MLASTPHSVICECAGRSVRPSLPSRDRGVAVVRCALSPSAGLVSAVDLSRCSVYDASQADSRATCKSSGQSSVGFAHARQPTPMRSNAVWLTYRTHTQALRQAATSDARHAAPSSRAQLRAGQPRLHITGQHGSGRHTPAHTPNRTRRTNPYHSDGPGQNRPRLSPIHRRGVWVFSGGVLAGQGFVCVTCDGERL